MSHRIMWGKKKRKKKEGLIKVSVTFTAFVQRGIREYEPSCGMPGDVRTVASPASGALNVTEARNICYCRKNII